MEILEHHENYLEVKPWKGSNVTAGFSTRQNGYSQAPFNSMNLGLHVKDQRVHVLKNRQKFSEWIKRPLSDWKSLNQVHSNEIIDLTTWDGDLNKLKHDEAAIDADGMLTDTPNHVLTAFYADCVPLLFKAKHSNLIGIAHAGWKGTVKNIGPLMVNKFMEKGIKPGEIEVIIGPCISKKNYEVDQRVVDHIPEAYHDEVLTPTTEGHFLLDLKRLNFLYLVDADVISDYIYITEYCTFKDEELFYSYRRDQGETGRMMAFIYLNNS
ncbi:peptidoglycan editing factor PgeF [Filobacillus milosensis]|nr:peptidoglycan editing factor PgeF [Filobacillus milosensis]